MRKEDALGKHLIYSEKMFESEHIEPQVRSIKIFLYFSFFMSEMSRILGAISLGNVRNKVLIDNELDQSLTLVCSTQGLVLYLSALNYHD
jgi:hypothetical protein